MFLTFEATMAFCNVTSALLSIVIVTLGAVTADNVNGIREILKNKKLN